MTDVAGGWPLTGRDPELRAMAEALDGPGGVLLAGAAGVGKSRLVREALAGAADRTKWVLATDSARRTPLGAFVPLLGTVPESSGAALTAAHAALPGRQTLLAVDDAHLLDDLSATLLHQLATDGGCRMAVTVRTGEPAPDAVTSLWKDGLLARLEVPALTPEATTALLERALGARVERAAARRMFTATAGNVLWLRHLVDGERAGGRLVRTADMWHWTGEPQLGPALTALIETRIGDLPGDVRRVVELLALAEPLGIELLQAMAGVGEVEDAADRELVTVTRRAGAWEVRLAHPLYGEAVRARLNPVRARRLRGRLAEALSGLGEGALRCAVLGIDSDLQPDPGLFLAAAGQASGLGDMWLAERLATASRDAGGGIEAQLLLAFVLFFQLRAEDAEGEFVRASALADSDALRLRVANLRAVNLYLILARIDEAHAVLDGAEQWAGSSVELLGSRAYFATMAGRFAEAEAGARRALGSPGVSAQCESYAAWMLTVLAGVTGRGDQIRPLAAQAAAAALRAPETALNLANITLFEIFGLGLAGRPGPAREAADAMIAAMSGPFATVARSVFDGWLALVTGRVAVATTLLCEFRPHYPGYGGGFTAWFELFLAQARGMAGDASGAREAIGRAEAARHPGLMFIDPWFGLTRAWLAAAEGSTTTAVRQARDAATIAAGGGQLAVEVLARHTAVGFGDRAQAVRLAELARRVDGPRAPAAAAHAAALATGNPTALLTAADRLAATALLLFAADAAAQAVVLHRKQGDLAAAAAAATRTDQLAAACPRARTPALLAAAQPLPITPRQREIAALAAARLSNREIADRLGVSVRTVEGHVYAACLTLGVSDRAALAALFTGTPTGGHRRSPSGRPDR